MGALPPQGPGGVPWAPRWAEQSGRPGKGRRRWERQPRLPERRAGGRVRGGERSWGPPAALAQTLRVAGDSGIRRLLPLRQRWARHTTTLCPQPGSVFGDDHSRFAPRPTRTSVGLSRALPLRGSQTAAHPRCLPERRLHARPQAPSKHFVLQPLVLGSRPAGPLLGPSELTLGKPCAHSGLRLPLCSPAAGRVTNQDGPSLLPSEVQPGRPAPRAGV